MFLDWIQVEGFDFHVGMTYPHGSFLKDGGLAFCKASFSYYLRDMHVDIWSIVMAKTKIYSRIFLYFIFIVQ